MWEMLLIVTAGTVRKASYGKIFCGRAAKLCAISYVRFHTERIGKFCTQANDTSGKTGVAAQAMQSVKSHQEHAEERNGIRG
jgi:hypothetical protein